MVLLSLRGGTIGQIIGLLRSRHRTLRRGARDAGTKGILGSYPTQCLVKGPLTAPGGNKRLLHLVKDMERMETKEEEL